MKKVLSLVLVIMMVLSSMSFAFATSFEDVEKTENEDLITAADLLDGLGIITGYEDGSFKPDQVVTRAEMAAMLIRARGFEQIATDTPVFTDCQTHWAKGYIALASDLGIINGRGNGIFDPDSVVTYQEAAVMMLRALGYDDLSINNGRSQAYNPANYRTKALNLRLFKDFALANMDDGATRGNIALMLNRNLSNSMVYTNEDGRAVVEMVDSKPVILLNSLAKKEKITVDAKLAAKDNLVDMTQYLYQEVDAYFVDDIVAFVDYVYSTVTTNYVTGATEATATPGKVSLYKDKAYDVNSANIKVFYNNAEVKYDDAWTYLKDSTATLVLDEKDNVLGIIADEETNAKFIKSVYKENSTVLNGIVLPTKSGKVDLSKVTVTGIVDAIEDIDVNDVVKAYASIGNTKVELLVVRDSIEGKVIKASNDHSSVFIDTVEEYRDADETLELKVLDEGIFYFDEEGAVFAFSGKQAATHSNYVMITDVESGAKLGTVVVSKPSITVLNTKGEEVTYTIAIDAEYSELDILAEPVVDSKKNVIMNPAYDENGTAPALTLDLNVAVGNIIESVKLNNKGELSTFVLQEMTYKTTPVATDSKTFDATSDVAIFNFIDKTGTADDEFYTNTLEELIALEDVGKNNFHYATNARGEYVIILVKEDLIVAADTPNGIIAEQQKVLNDDGKIVHELVTYVDGEKVTYLSTTALGKKDNVEAGTDLVKFTLSSGLVTNVSTVATTAAITIESDGLNKADNQKITNVTSKSFVIADLDANGKIIGSDKYFMNDTSSIYIFNAKGQFLRVGTMDDLESVNIIVNVYGNAIDPQLVEDVIIIAK